METDISTFVRLKKWEVDEQQRVLAEILERVAYVEKCQRDLEDILLKEQKVAAEDPEGAGFAYGRFANAAIDQRAHYLAVLQELEVEMSQQREKIAEAYKDFKTAEQLQKNREKREALKQNRKTQADMDEMASMNHRRKTEDGL